MVFGPLLLLRSAFGRRRGRLAVGADEPAAEMGPALPPAAPEAGSFVSMNAAVDRALAPLLPAFQAMAKTWPSNMPPERVLRAVLLMALFGLPSATALAARVVAERRLRRFLGLREDSGPLDAAAVLDGQDRLVANSNARDVVRSVVTSVRRLGLFGQDGLIENERLIATWTGEPSLASAPAALS